MYLRYTCDMMDTLQHGFKKKRLFFINFFVITLLFHMNEMTVNDRYARFTNNIIIIHMRYDVNVDVLLYAVHNSLIAFVYRYLTFNVDCNFNLIELKRWHIDFHVFFFHETQRIVIVLK